MFIPALFLLYLTTLLMFLLSLFLFCSFCVLGGFCIAWIDPRVTSRVQIQKDAIQLKVAADTTVPVSTCAQTKLDKSLLLSRSAAYDDVSEGNASSDADDDELDRMESEDEEKQDMKQLKKTSQTCLRLTKQNKGKPHHSNQKHQIDDTQYLLCFDGT